MANRALGRRDLFDGRLTNSGTKLIFRIIEGRSWPTREKSETNLMVHSKKITSTSNAIETQTFIKFYHFCAKRVSQGYSLTFPLFRCLYVYYLFFFMRDVYLRSFRTTFDTTISFCCTSIVFLFTISFFFTPIFCHKSQWNIKLF